MSTWIVWHVYISRTIGGLGDTSPGGAKIVNAIFNSLLLSNLIDVVFFLYKALYPVILYFLVGITSIIFMSKRKLAKLNNTEKILAIIIIVTNILMFSGTLYFSVTFVWWNQIPDSYLKSNLIMIPLMGILTGSILQKILSKRKIRQN